MIGIYKLKSYKDIAILKELNENPYGLRVKTLMRLTSLTNKTIYNHLNKLKKAGLVEHIYPIWKLCKIQSKPSEITNLLKGNKIQLHNLSFVLRLLNKPYWWEQRNNRLIKLKEFQVRTITWGNNPYVQMIKDNFIIQIFSNSIIFINNKEYYGEDSYDCFIKATRDFLDLYKYIEETFKFKFFIDGVPQVSVRSQHYVRLRDAIAKRCKRKKEKFEIIIDNKLRLWVDMSEPLGVEAGHKNYAPEDMRKYNNVVVDYITKDLPLPSKMAESQEFIINTIKEMLQFQKTEQQKWSYYAENIKTHTNAIKKLEVGINRFTDLNIRVSQLDHPQYHHKHISEDLCLLLKNIKSVGDIDNNKAKIILLSKEEKKILEDYLMDL